MRIDPRTVVASMGILGLLLTGLATVLWRTRRTYPGFGRWATAGVLAMLSLFLMSLPPNVPELIRRMAANTVLVCATVLYVDGARRIRGRSAGSGLVYAGAVLTVCGYAFFLYVMRSPNVRAALMSTFMGAVLLVAARTLVRQGPITQSLGLRVTAGLFALCGATSLVRAVYNGFGPANAGLFLSGVQGALDYGTAVPMSLFPIGFLLLADEAVVSDLLGAKKRALQANAEAARYRYAADAVRESERLFRNMSDTAPVMIWTSGVDKQVTYVNQRWLDFTGWLPDQVPGHQWIELLHPDDIERCGTVYATAFDQSQPFQVEHRLRRHDDEYRWILTVGAPRYDTDGSFCGYVGTATDITDRRQAAVALRDRTLELERRTNQLRQMASDLTFAEQRMREETARTLHDGLQQLLVVAAMNVENHIRHEAQRGAPAHTLVEAKDHLGEAIAAARSLSIELFPPVLHTSGLPAALAWLSEWARSKYGLEVTVSADPRADSDRKDLRIVLFESVRELLFNVIKHARVDRAAVDLALGPDNTLCITVTDDGLGFDPAKVEERAKAGQVGWGLFSIRERLTLLDGQFEVESAPGRGATFRLKAPVAMLRLVGTESPLSPATVSPPIRYAVGDGSPMALRILVVDDHPVFRKGIGELLQSRSEFQVVGEAVNGLEAITRAHLLRPDVVLMDVSMPEMDGVEATRRIRAELPFVQVLGLSMDPRLSGPHAIELAGAEAFFTKGVDTQRLIDHLLVAHAVVCSARSSANPPPPAEDKPKLRGTPRKKARK